MHNDTEQRGNLGFRPSIWHESLSYYENVPGDPLTLVGVWVAKTWPACGPQSKLLKRV